MKTEEFKHLIKEFHETELPSLHKRELSLPKTKKIITLSGSRRAGKTFYFYRQIKELSKKTTTERIIYINFEDDRLLPLNIKDMDDLLKAYYSLYPENKGKKIYLFLDEVQNINSWETYVRRIYDKENVQLFITGSSSKLLSREISTRLRGRTLTFNVYPLSFKEFLQFNWVRLDKNLSYSKERFRVIKFLEEFLSRGGFPEVVLEENNLEPEILSNYFEIMIYKDIVERFSVRNTALLKRLAKYLITNTATNFSINAYYNAIKKDVPVSKETLLEYTSYLEEANVIFLVPLFSYSLKKQQINPKKVYCIDTGLRNAVAFKFSKDIGRLAENLVFIELKRRKKEPRYWKKKGEVDFVVKDQKHRLTAINVSYTNNIKKRELDSLIEFKKEFRKTKELILITKDLEKEEEGIRFIPLWKWLLKGELNNR